jgi:hypothetical protein
LLYFSAVHQANVHVTRPRALIVAKPTKRSQRRYVISMDWLSRSRANREDVTYTGHASISIQKAYLVDPFCDPPHDEETMRQLLAAIYESGDLNFLRDTVEVLAYARRSQPPRDDPESVLYDIWYRSVRTPRL